MPPPEISIVKPERSATIPPDVPVTIEANVTSRVTSSELIIEVRVHYESSRDRLSESSPFRILSEDSPLGKYRGIIPTDDNEKEQTIWYFVKVTDALGGEAASEIRMVRVRKPLGIWTSHSWSNYISKNGSINSDSERGNVFSIAYLSEGKDSQTLGAQLDFAYEHPENTSAIVQWGPRLKESSVSFALRGGIAGYRHFDSGSPQATYSNQFTPVLGGSLRLYPLDGVVVDVTGLMRTSVKQQCGRRRIQYYKGLSSSLWDGHPSLYESYAKFHCRVRQMACGRARECKCADWAWNCLLRLNIANHRQGTAAQ